jgi:hypothetical protein
LALLTTITDTKGFFFCNEMSKGFSKGYELEQVLLRRMEQRYVDGECCSSISDFFESDSDKETHFSVLGDLGKRKARVVLPDGDGVLGVPGDGGQNGSAAFCPPTTNRGVTFHVPIKEKDQSVFEQITQTVEGFKGQSCPRIMGR